MKRTFARMTLREKCSASTTTWPLDSWKIASSALVDVNTEHKRIRRVSVFMDSVDKRETRCSSFY